MGSAGRPRKYDTPEKAAEARKKSNKISKKIFNAKVESDPILKKKVLQNQVIYNATYNSKKTPEQKQRDREYNTNYQRKRRALLRQFQQKVSNEQSAEIMI